MGVEEVVDEVEEEEVAGWQNRFNKPGSQVNKI